MVDVEEFRNLSLSLACCIDQGHRLASVQGATAWTERHPCDLRPGPARQIERWAFYYAREAVVFVNDLWRAGDIPVLEANDSTVSVPFIVRTRLNRSQAYWG
jgi:hypothetical protein